MNNTSLLSHLIRFRVDVYLNSRICGNWRIETPSAERTSFHMITQGRCSLSVPGHTDTLLNEGDLVLFARELEHVMTPLDPVGDQEMFVQSYAASDPAPGTGFLCAEVNFQYQASALVLSELPPVLIVRGTEVQWLKALAAMIIAETGNPGPISCALTDRLGELLFIYGLAHYFSDYPEKKGLLALYAHPRLAASLKAIHGDPGSPWTVETLAREAAMSRTSFANTFRDHSGWTPMQYLTWWRLQLAREHLHAGISVSETASLVGFQSQATFSRAFKRYFGLTPGAARSTAA